MADASISPAPGSAVYSEVHDSLARMGLVGTNQPIALEPMSGGVSSDIWRVDAPPATFCVKRALARLKVAADWQAPVCRNRYEVRWFRTVGAIVPAAVPAILGDDEFAGAFAMTFLPPERYPVWK